MKAYKLTDENGKTNGNTQWGENVTHTATGTGTQLCSDGFIHYHTDPVLAVLLNPIHANFQSPILWECEVSGDCINEPLKSGSKTVTTIRQIPMPVITETQKIAFAILCAQQICKDIKWNSLANNWLRNIDRTRDAASASAYAASAARTAAYVAYADFTIDFVVLAHEALTYS